MIYNRDTIYIWRALNELTYKKEIRQFHSLLMNLIIIVLYPFHKISYIQGMKEQPQTPRKLIQVNNLKSFVKRYQQDKKSLYLP